MIDSPIADVTAEVWDSQAGTELEAGRVVMSRERLLLVTDEREAEIPLPAVFDIAPDESPAHLTQAEESGLTIGYYLDGTRNTAAVQATADAIDRLTLLLFRSVLQGTDVIMADPGMVDGELQPTPPREARLAVSREQLSLETGERTRSVGISEVTGFERVAIGDGGSPITVGVRRRRGDVTVRMDLTFDGHSSVNVFGRFLRTYSDAVGESDSPVSVLFIDDEPDLAETMATVIEQNHPGVTAGFADSPVEGLDRLGENPEVDCVVSDYRMPDMNGLEFLGAVRDVRPNLPFILLTGKGSEAVAEEALARGVTDYVRKDSLATDYSDLVARIEQAVAHLRPHTGPFRAPEVGATQ